LAARLTQQQIVERRDRGRISNLAKRLDAGAANFRRAVIKRLDQLL